MAGRPRARAKAADANAEEELVAKAEAEGTDSDQTPEDAVATAKIAEEGDFEKVPDVEELDEDALVAKAEGEGTDIDQTPEEAEATARIAEEGDFQAVPVKDEDPKGRPEEHELFAQIEILEPGFFVAGAIPRAGQKITVPYSVFSQDAEAQKAAYGKVYFKRV